ncbi:hypothetical protein CPB97_011743, partial [Podila verticillata]
MEFPGWTGPKSIKAYISHVPECLEDDDSRQALSDSQEHYARYELWLAPVSHLITTSIYDRNTVQNKTTLRAALPSKNAWENFLAK